VTWAISQGQIVLLDAGASAETPNALDGVVVRYVRLGNNAAITVGVDGLDRPPLFMSVPLHVARSHGVREGGEVRIALLPEGIHLMAPDVGAEAEAEKHRRIQPASDIAA
jgi:hypothetical protein